MSLIASVVRIFLLGMRGFNRFNTGLYVTIVQGWLTFLDDESLVKAGGAISNQLQTIYLRSWNGY